MRGTKRGGGAVADSPIVVFILVALVIGGSLLLVLRP